eukprot:792770-Heterocapsa_arctica.AAC.1
MGLLCNKRQARPARRASQRPSPARKRCRQPAREGRRPRPAVAPPASSGRAPPRQAKMAAEIA